MAIEIQLDQNCLVTSNSRSIASTGSSCSSEEEKDIWYHFTGNQNALHRLEVALSEMDSLFNNTLTIYSGDCGNLQEITCFNEDEYGFLGEIAYLNVVQGEKYFVKISGLDFEFGRTAGQSCIALKVLSEQPVAMDNDLCEQAAVLLLNDDWKGFENRNATIDDQYISALERNRADLWFAFDLAEEADVWIESNADFSHTIGLYEGNCSNLNLLEKSLSGFSLSAKNLSANKTYYIQISGRFSTLEGDFDIRITSEEKEELVNNDCSSSISYEGDCLPFSSLAASFSEQYPTCLFYAQNDLWFDFTPEIAGDYKLNVQSDFLFTVAVYQKECAELEELVCGEAIPCDGAIDLKNLIAGEKYLIQILSNNEYFVNEGGEGCLEIIHLNDYDFYPLSLAVSTICISDSVAILDVKAKNGKGNYTFHGNTDGQELSEGSPFFVQVTDEAGCHRIEQGMVSCAQPNNDCDLYFNIETTDYDCTSQIGGTATLTVFSSANYFITWSTAATTPSISDLDPGQYSIDITNPESGTCTYVFEITAKQESYPTFYADQDGDGFGDPNSFIKSCTAIAGFVVDSTDCEDTNPNINPNQVEEAYNGLDDDCNPESLDDDLDKDGFPLAEDCDDLNPNINPDATEIPNNGIDDNCDGEVDEITSVRNLGTTKLKIYPNPASHTIHLELDASLDFEVKLYDISGRLFQSFINATQLNVTSLPSGMYLLEIKDLKSAQTVVEKIVVQQ